MMIGGEEYWQKKADEIRQRRLRREEKLKSDIRDGVVRGTVKTYTLTNGKTAEIVRKWEPKGIQNWYSTRELVERVTEIMNRNEKATGRRVCHINGRWQLQIRGKHLRRLLKKMPNVRQQGRTLIEENA
jgi:hypothetical protein